YPDLAIEKRLMTTKGDKILNAPLAKIGGKGLFTKELETAMLAGEIDIAVHSLKDMPVVVPEGLVITAVTERADAGDALVSQRYESFAALPEGAKVGTSSLRRRAQLLHARPDLQIVDLRGNVNTRLRKLEEENFDGIILACAGLKRLGFGERIRQVLPRFLCLPAVGQGALAIESRIDDRENRELLSFLDDGITRACTAAERGFLATVEGGCQVPVGVYAQPVNNADILQDAHAGKAEAIRVEAVIASLDGRKLFRDSVEGAADEAENLGISLANKLLDMGGREILRSLGIEL
ncbi:MAG: hydroxymethylbilane synthase, partial [Selenomonadaceae bacterium]|nr:hydroxymethylbilane synthase [Selenomonadaceae bacterium]